MRIVHLSYAQILTCNDPKVWLEKINFYTGVLEQMATANEILSIHCINYEGSLTNNGVGYHFLKASLWKYFFPFSVNSHVKNLKPDVVIVHGLIFSWQIFLLIIQLGKSARIFVQHHAEKPLRFPKRTLQKINDRFISGYFFSSVELGKIWLAEGLISQENKIHEVMEISSPFYPIASHEARDRSGIKGAAVYLWVGRLDENKDPETLLKGFVSFAKDHLSARLYLIYSEGVLIERVKKLADMVPDRVILVGKVEHQEMLYWYNSADFIISTSHYEGSGTAICEAMSCGCIPILSDIPSFRMMTGHSACGLLFATGDATALKHALFKSINLNIDNEKSRVIRQFKSNLSFSAIASKIEKTITEI